jgi:hypothetical protein
MPKSSSSGSPRSAEAAGASKSLWISLAVIGSIFVIALFIVWQVFKPAETPKCVAPEVFVDGLGCTERFLRCVHEIGLSKLTDDLKQEAKTSAEHGISVDGDRAKTVIAEYTFPDETKRRLAEDCERLYLPPALATSAPPASTSPAVALPTPSARRNGPAPSLHDSGCADGTAACAGGTCTLRCSANGAFGDGYRAACLRAPNGPVRCLIQGAPGGDATAICNPERLTQGQFAWGACR